MKSAFELAMERLAAKEGASATVPESLKRRLADIDAKYRAKIAEREIIAAQRETAARASGDVETVAALREALRRERAELEAQAETEKSRARAEADR